MSDGSSSKWYVSRDRLYNTPSQQRGMTAEMEQAGYMSVTRFLQEMRKRLTLSNACCNTALLFTQRFYLHHPMQVFDKHQLAAAALLLACKVDEQPRKIEAICNVARSITGNNDKNVKNAAYINDMEVNENFLLGTLNFELAVVHPHAVIVQLCAVLKLDKTLSSNAYIYATYCLYLRMCLLYSPYTIACLCLHMGIRRNGIFVPPHEGKPWYQLKDPSLTEETLDRLCEEFVENITACPDKYKHSALISSLTPKFIDNILSQPSSPVPSPSGRDASWCQNLNSLHDKIKKLVQKQKKLEASKPKRNGCEETTLTNQNPNKHARKLQITPKKNESPSGIHDIKPTRLSSALPFNATRSEINIHTYDSTNKSKNRSQSLAPSHTVNANIASCQAWSSNSIPNDKKMRSGGDFKETSAHSFVVPNSPVFAFEKIASSNFIPIPTSKNPGNFSATSSRIDWDLPHLPRALSNNMQLEPLDDSLGMKLEQMNSCKNFQPTASYSFQQVSNLESIKQEPSNEPIKTWEPNPEPIDFGASFSPVSWGSQPSLSAAACQPSSSLKISIPKSRIIQQTATHYRPATPEDVKTDKNKVYRIPTAASMGSVTGQFNLPKRFKPNPEE